MASNAHIIRKALLEVSAGSADTGAGGAFAFQHEVVAWARECLVPELEAAFAALPEIDAHVLIDRLEIQVDAGDPARWGTDTRSKLKTDLTAALIRKLLDGGGGNGEARLDPASGFFRNLAFYLEHGVLPWNLSATTPADLVGQLEKWADAEESKSRAPDLAVLWRLPPARMRFLSSFPPILVARILIRLFRMPEYMAASWSRDAARIAFSTGSLIARPRPSAPPAISLPPLLLREILSALSHNPRIFEQGLEEEIVHAYLGHALLELAIQPREWKSIPFESAAFTRSLDRILRQSPEARLRGSQTRDLDPVSLSPERPGPADGIRTPAFPLALMGPSAQADPPAQVDLDLPDNADPELSSNPALEGLYVANAGLILLAPFLSMLFERLELAGRGELKDPATAIGLMHFLATGQEGPAEFQVPLAKVLSGLTLQQAITFPVTLAETMKAEATQLLESVIGHWGILKSTSVDGLREGFLQRQGKLSQREKGDWLLQVEQKPYDMLLQQLPWSFQIIRLPWMKHVLRTEWIE